MNTCPGKGCPLGKKVIAAVKAVAEAQWDFESR